MNSTNRKAVFKRQRKCTFLTTVRIFHSFTSDERDSFMGFSLENAKEPADHGLMSRTPFMKLHQERRSASRAAMAVAAGLFAYWAGAPEAIREAPVHIQSILKEYCYDCHAGDGGDALAPGRFVQQGSRPIRDLFLSRADRMGVQTVERFGDSTGRLANV